MNLKQKLLAVIFAALVSMFLVAVYPTPLTVFIAISLVSILGIVQTFLVLKSK